MPSICRKYLQQGACYHLDEETIAKTTKIQVFMVLVACKRISELLESLEEVLDNVEIFAHMKLRFKRL